MKQLKLALIGSLIAGTITYAFFTWTNSTERTERLAFEKFQKGSNRDSYELLIKLEDQLSAPKLALLQNYPLRANNLIARSNQRIQQGLSLIPELSTIKSHETKELAMELALNLSLNGHINQDTAKEVEGLKIARELYPKSGWTALFTAMHEEKEHNWKEVLNALEGTKNPEYLSDWMEIPFKKVFTRQWKDLLIARASIEVGQTVKARTYLSNLEKDKILEPNNFTLRFLYGLSYIVEAEQKPQSVTMGFYKLAYSYLKDLPLKESEYQKENERVSKAFSEQALRSLREENVDNLSFFINALNHWYAEKALKPIASAYIDWLSKEQFGTLIPSLKERALNLDPISSNPHWEEFIEEILLARLNTALKERNWAKVQQFWTLSQLSGALDANFEDKVAFAVENNIFDHFLLAVRTAGEQDSPGTSAYEGVMAQIAIMKQSFPLLEEVANHPARIQALLERMVEQSSVLISGQTVSFLSTPIYEFIISIAKAPEAENLKRRVSRKLEKRFEQARDMRDIPTMSMIFDIAYELSLNVIPDYSKEKLANMVADAKFMLKSEKVDTAREQLAWVLKLDPDNKPAQELLGNSLFMAEDYSRAITVLESIESPDSITKQMLAISYLQTNHSDKAFIIIEELENLGVLLGDRMLLDLALHYSTMDQFESSSQRLLEIKDKNSDVWIYLMVNAFVMNEPQKVWDYFSQLPPGMRTSGELTSLTMRALKELNLFAMSENLLERALENPTQSSILSPAVQDYASRYISEDDQDLSLSAAEFFQDTKNNPEKVLLFLQNPKKTSWRIHVQRALAYIKLNNPKLAENEVLPLVKSQTLDSVHLPIWLTLARAQMQIGEYGLALETLDLIDHTLGILHDPHVLRAKLMMDTQRYDLAEPIWRDLNEKTPLIPEELVLFIECLTKTEKFKEAIYWVDQITSMDIDSSTLWNVARVSWPAFSHLQIPQLTPNRNVFDQLKSEQQGVALQYLLESGKAYQAIAWSKSFEGELKKNFEGALALGMIYANEMNFEEAEEYFKLCLSDSKANLSQQLKLIECIYTYLPDTKLLEKANHQFVFSETSNWKHFIVAASAQVHYNLAIEKYWGLLDEKDLSSLNQIKQSLIKRRGEFAEFTQSHWILGLVHSLMAEPALAEAQFKWVEAKNPSYIYSNLQLSQLLLIARQWDLSIELARKALDYNPYSAQAWLTLSQSVYEKASFKENDPQLLDDSKKYVNKSLILGPYLSSAYHLLGTIEMKQKDWEGAHLSFRKSLKIQPGQPDVINKLILTIKQRISHEGVRIEWQQELDELENSPNLRLSLQRPQKSIESF